MTKQIDSDRFNKLISSIQLNIAALQASLSQLGGISLDMAGKIDDGVILDLDDVSDTSNNALADISYNVEELKKL